MEETSTFVGLDVHKDTIAVAMLLPGHEVPLEWEVANDAGAVRRPETQLRRQQRRAVLLLRSRPLRLHAATPARGGRRGLHGDRMRHGARLERNPRILE